MRLPIRVFKSALAVVAAIGSVARSTRHAQDAAGNRAPDQPEAARALTMSEAEIKFGASPRHDSQVIYQANVIVMEHGADAIRSQSTDGFTWTIDASAPGAAQIQPDKILFATGRVVGRVLKVERKGDNLDVTLGPAELTDIFEEAHISTHGALDPAQMIVY